MQRNTTLLCALLTVVACDDGSPKAECPEDMDDDELTDAADDEWAVGVVVDGCLIDPWTGILACRMNEAHIVVVTETGSVLQNTWSVDLDCETYEDVLSTKPNYVGEVVSCEPE